MKKFILTILFYLFISFGFAQSSNFSTYDFIFPMNGSYGWQNSVGLSLGEAYCGLEGLYTGISRSERANQYGNYEYSIWMSTNSFTPKKEGCDLTLTYAEKIYIYYWNSRAKKWQFPAYFSVIWGNIGEAKIIYYLYSPNSNLFIKVKVGKYKISSY